jgi:hypothetical protein
MHNQRHERFAMSYAPANNMAIAKYGPPKLGSGMDTHTVFIIYGGDMRCSFLGHVKSKDEAIKAGKDFAALHGLTLVWEGL